MKKKRTKKVKIIKRVKKTKRRLRPTRRPLSHRPASKRKRKKISAKKKFKIPRGRPKKVFLPEKFRQLVEKGKQRGFITPSEILSFFPEIERDIKGLEKLYEDLEKEGIEVKEAKEFLEVKEKKAEKKPSVVKIDPIQMYLKEIGALSFVTAEEEKELAKRIEKGDEEARIN